MNKIVTKNDLYNLLIENNRQNDAETEISAFSDFSSNKCLTYDNIINTSRFFTINEKFDKNKLVAKKYLSILDNAVIYGDAIHGINVKINLPSILYNQNYEILPKSFEFNFARVLVDKNNIIKLSSIPKTFKTNIFFIFGKSGYDVEDDTKGEADIYGLSLTYIGHDLENNIKFKIGEFDDSIPLPDNLVNEYNIGTKGTLPTCTELIGKDIEFINIYELNDTYEIIEFDANHSECKINGGEYTGMPNFIYDHDYETPNGYYYYNDNEYCFIGDDYANVVINKIPKYDYDNIPYNFYEDVIYDVYDESGTNLLESFKHKCLLPLSITGDNTVISAIGLIIRTNYVWEGVLDGVDDTKYVEIKIVDEDEVHYRFEVIDTDIHIDHSNWYDKYHYINKSDIIFTANYIENVYDVDINFDYERECLSIDENTLEYEQVQAFSGREVINRPKLNNNGTGYNIKIRLPEWWKSNIHILERCDVVITPEHGEGTPEDDLHDSPVLVPERLRFGPYFKYDTSTDISEVLSQEYQNLYDFYDYSHESNFFSVDNKYSSFIIRNYCAVHDDWVEPKSFELYTVVISDAHTENDKTFDFNREMHDDY